MINNGKLDVIIGCMFSGKTTKIINLVNTYKSINKKVLNINYLLDIRYGENQIISHDQQKILSLNIENLSILKEKYKELYNECDIVCINEAQFFKDLKSQVLDFIYNDNKHIIVSGLDGDYKQEPFGQILDLIPHAENITKLSAFCKICNNGTQAFFTKRIIDNDNLVLIGGNESYLPVCRFHLKNNN